MSEETVLPPTAIVVRRQPIPRRTDKAGLPTAHSRVDIFQSKAVVIPALQQPEDAKRPTPVFMPLRYGWGPRYVIGIGCLIALAVIAILAYLR